MYNLCNLVSFYRNILKIEYEEVIYTCVCGYVIFCLFSFIETKEKT